ncbi:hypothetical protein FDB55_03425 [Clostridium botulinum]|nr:hypothetical protein [Clostridium botulinum]NFN20797.1 hypothetical protein [Clostridium botulinum]NFN42015.1 hypothetical protein [Clostridium botulinum]
MDLGTKLGLVFSGICTVEAIISIISVIRIHNEKKEVYKIKDEIEAYRNTILSKNDLIILLPKIDLVKDLAKTFGKISTKVIPQPGDSKSELDYYVIIKNSLSEVLNDIPSEYKNIRKILKEIKDSLGYCITNNKTFKDLSQLEKYNYKYVETKFDSLLNKLNELTRGMRFNN